MTQQEGRNLPKNVPEADGETRSVGGEIEVEASADVVWKAPTDARELERWFALEARVEPGAGGSIFLSWKNEYAGESEILVWDPPFHLQVRWMEGAEVTDYRLEDRGRRTLLTVTSSFSMDPRWDDWVEGTRRGWRFQLRSLKHYLERHAGEDRTVLQLRWGVELSPEEVWDRLTGSRSPADELLRGRLLYENPPHHLVVVTRTPEDGLLLVSNEPSMGEPGGREAGVWLAAWGSAGRCVAGAEEGWRRELQRVLPGGEEIRRSAGSDAE